MLTLWPKPGKIDPDADRVDRTFRSRERKIMGHKSPGKADTTFS